MRDKLLYRSLFFLSFSLYVISLIKNNIFVYPSGDQGTELSYIFANANGDIFFHGQDIGRLSNVSEYGHPYFPGPIYYWYLALWVKFALLLNVSLTYLFISIGLGLISLVLIYLSGLYWERYFNNISIKYIYLLLMIFTYLASRNRFGIQFATLYTPHIAQLLLATVVPLALVSLKERRGREIYLLIIFASFLWQVQTETAPMGVFYGLMGLILSFKSKLRAGWIIYIISLSPLLIRLIQEKGELILSYIRIKDGGSKDQLGNIFLAFKNQYVNIDLRVVYILFSLQILLICWEYLRRNKYPLIVYAPVYMTIAILLYNPTKSEWNAGSTYALWWDYLLFTYILLYISSKYIDKLNVLYGVLILTLIPIWVTTNTPSDNGKIGLFSKSPANVIYNIPGIEPVYNEIVNKADGREIQITTPSNDWKDDMYSNEVAIFQSLYLNGRLHGVKICSFDRSEMTPDAKCKSDNINSYKIVFLYGDEVIKYRGDLTYIGSLGEVYIFGERDE